ncbi:ATP synthase F1 subunit gamma [bacterium]|nr:MAG: ATP synthase F1 subunit gamma [bacterium]
MASLRDIKRKIRVVKNIAQITQAMKMVAAAKLRRVQDRVQKGKPYANTMAELVGALAPNVKDFSHPLLTTREVSRVLVVVIAGDKGLCGAYNSNILRLGHRFLDSQIAQYGAGNVQLVTIGRKAGEYFTKRGYSPIERFPGIGPETPYEQIRAVSNTLTGLFASGQVDEVHICYSEFVSPLVQRPQNIKFLPIEPPAADATASENAGATSEFIFEPKIEELLGVLLPRYVETRVYQLLMEATASEFGARMTAMSNATKNAGEQIDKLTLLANRTRQAGITKELLDIIGGAEALNG